MPASAFTLLSNQQFTNSAVTGNGTFALWSSPSQTTPQGNNAIRCVVEFTEVTPAAPPNSVSYGLALVLEALGASGLWYPLAYQFEPFNTADNGRKRLIVAEPTLIEINPGIDNIIYVGGVTIARESKQRARMPATWRACLLCSENGFGQPSAFQGALVNIYGETYDVAS